MPKFFSWLFSLFGKTQSESPAPVPAPAPVVEAPKPAPAPEAPKPVGVPSVSDYGQAYYKSIPQYGKDKMLPYNIMKWWMGNLDTKEISGSKDNPFIVWCHKTWTSLKASDDETAWCASSMNAAVGTAGFKGTNSAAAVSFLKFGKELSQLEQGCIVVLQHPNGGHHVAFFDHLIGDYIFTLGGNQSNQIKISAFHKSEIMKGGMRSAV